MQNITLTDIHQELAYIHKKIDRIEHLLIPEVEASKQDKKDLEEAMAEHHAGTTISYKQLKKR